MTCLICCSSNLRTKILENVLRVLSEGPTHASDTLVICEIYLLTALLWPHLCESELQERQAKAVAGIVNYQGDQAFFVGDATN